MPATPKQIGYIRFLASKKGLDGKIAAMMAYGFAPTHSLTVRDASELIDWLKS